jgi:hypothetical protein
MCPDRLSNQGIKVSVFQTALRSIADDDLNVDISTNSIGSCDTILVDVAET